MTNSMTIIGLPFELQVNLLTYLRAYDLSAVQKTCRFYANPALVHAIVAHTAEHVYPPDLTEGFAKQPLTCAIINKIQILPEIPQGPINDASYTFEHLRNMELLVIARVLSRPEPSSATHGFVVSKSWCKAALKWLEVQQQDALSSSSTPKKLSKKKQRMRERRLSDASPPWPNVNSDLLCEHQSLQRCSNSKSARARRRILDKQAWKILKKLYPDSTPLQTECLTCLVEAETARKNHQDALQQAKLDRKKPLADPNIRRFYTRTRGVPEEALRSTIFAEDYGLERKLSTFATCPLIEGKYFILPRAWCHGWRRFLKTGSVGNGNNNTTPTCASTFQHYPPPDAASLLCHAHRIALLPPHLEAFLYGESSQLLESSCHNRSGLLARRSTFSEDQMNIEGSVVPVPRVIPGQVPDDDSVRVLLAAGLSAAEVARQLSAMREMERIQEEQQRLEAAALPSNVNNRNEMLDRENHLVTEILTAEEFHALEQQWPETNVFGLSFDVTAAGHVQFNTPICKDCDATGRQCTVSIKNRARGWVKKSAEKARAPASLEY